MSIIEKAAKRLAKGRRKGGGQRPQSSATPETDTHEVEAGAIDDGLNPFGTEEVAPGPERTKAETAATPEAASEPETAPEPAAFEPASDAEEDGDTSATTASRHPVDSAPSPSEQAQSVAAGPFDDRPSQPPEEDLSPFRVDERAVGAESAEPTESATVDSDADRSSPEAFDPANELKDLDSPFADLNSQPAEGEGGGKHRSSIATAYSQDVEGSPFEPPTSVAGGEGGGPPLDVLGEGSLSGEAEEWRFDDIESGDENIIPLTKLKPGMLLSPEGGRTRSAEEFRVIKRPLLVKAFGRRNEGQHHSNLIMVTSAVQSEGKTFISLNLAISIAMEMDSTVLLVDADVAKPGLSKVLQIPERPGLIEQLTDEHDELADLLIRTDIPKLTVLPAGARHKRSTELLASIKMRGLLDEMASRYSDRIVLFDSPPLLESTEAFVLASQMGQVVMVVESEGTSQMVVKEALSQFDNLDNVSLVLNKCKENVFTNLLSGKYSGYGYGYGYGAESDSG